MQDGPKSSYRSLVPALVVALCTPKGRLNSGGPCKIFQFRSKLMKYLAGTTMWFDVRYIH